MNKKQRNRKLVSQNKRNRMINRRYTTTIKTLTKLFYSKINQSFKDIEVDIKKEKIEEIKIVAGKLFSILDKAVKKNVIHRNTAARKKSKIGKIKIDSLC
jgi:small subunit ribosomal protein S20